MKMKIQILILSITAFLAFSACTGKKQETPPPPSTEGSASSLSTESPTSLVNQVTEEEEEVDDEPIISQHVVDESKWGKLIIDLVEEEHPVGASVKMTVSVLCNKQRETKAVPEKEPLVVKQVCDFDWAKTDPKKKDVVNIHYFLRAKDTGPSDYPCNEGWEQPFDLTKLCKSWGPKKKK